MLRLFARFALSLAAVAGMVVIPEAASALPIGTSLVGCSVTPSSSVQDPTFCSLSGSSTASASASFPFVTLTASASSSAGSGTQGHATAGATYYFQVVGGNVGDVVPVFVQMTL